jgi:hypothetical protein
MNFISFFSGNKELASLKKEKKKKELASLLSALNYATCALNTLL